MREDGLPLGWLKCRTGEVADLVRGVSYQKQDARGSAASSYKPILRANNIDGVINLDDLVYVPHSLISDDQILRTGDVLFAMSSGSRHLVGKSALVKNDIDAGFGAFCGVLRPSGQISAKFLFWVFQTRQFRRAISEVAKGSNINNLKREHLLDYEVPLAPLAEQKRIVTKIEELFSELEAGEESLRTARRQLATYRQSLLKQAFQGHLTAQWREQNPDPTTKLPFREVAISEVLTSKPTNGRSVKDRKGGFRVLRLTAIKNGLIDLCENKEGDWEAAEAAAHIVRKGNFLLSRGNGSIRLVGRGGIVREDAEIAFPDTMIRLPLDLEHVEPFFFAYLWNSQVVRNQIESSARTTAGIHKINQVVITRYRIPLCPLPEQREIVRLLDEQFEVIERNEREIDAALRRSEALRQSILHRAFTGRLVPQDPADEPATELLARLRAEKAQAPVRQSRKKRSVGSE